MRTRRHVNNLWCRTRATLARHRDRADSLLRVVHPLDHKQAVGSVVVDLYNLWYNFCRDFFLLCHHGVRLRGGVVAGHSLRGNTESGSVLLAAQACNPRLAGRSSIRWGEEPKWADPHQFIKSCVALQCSHVPAIQAAMSIQTRAFEDVRTVRHFFAHKNTSTAKKALSLSRLYVMPKYPHPISMLAGFPAGRSVPLLVDWIDDIYLVCDAITQ